MRKREMALGRATSWNLLKLFGLLFLVKPSNPCQLGEQTLNEDDDGLQANRKGHLSACPFPQSHFCLLPNNIVLNSISPWIHILLYSPRLNKACRVCVFVLHTLTLCDSYKSKCWSYKCQPSFPVFHVWSWGNQKTVKSWQQEVHPSIEVC